jgi:hypothetical protein
MTVTGLNMARRHRCRLSPQQFNREKLPPVVNMAILQPAAVYTAFYRLVV